MFWITLLLSVVIDTVSLPYNILLLANLFQKPGICGHLSQCFGKRHIEMDLFQKLYKLFKMCLYIILHKPLQERDSLLVRRRGNKWCFLIYLSKYLLFRWCRWIFPNSYIFPTITLLKFFLFLPRTLSFFPFQLLQHSYVPQYRVLEGYTLIGRFESPKFHFRLRGTQPQMLAA